jgi:hypothetical protein
MQEVEQIEPEEKPSEDQASYYEESSTNIFANICIPIIEDDVYSISNLFSEIHVEDIWHESQDLHAETFSCTMHASQESHADTFACTMHASQESKRESRTSNIIMIFYEKKLHKQIRYLNFSWENIQLQKKYRPKRSPESEVMIVSKSTKFQHFSGNGRTVFKLSSKIYLDIIHYKKIKWICLEMLSQESTLGCNRAKP